MVCSYVLIAMPSVNIFGAPIGTLICNIVVVTINFYFLARRAKFFLPIRKICVAPAIVAAISVGLGCVVYLGLSRSPLSLAVSTLISISFVALIYFVMLFLFGIVKKEDLDLGK